MHFPLVCVMEFVSDTKLHCTNNALHVEKIEWIRIIRNELTCGVT